MAEVEVDERCEEIVDYSGLSCRVFDMCPIYPSAKVVSEVEGPCSRYVIDLPEYRELTLEEFRAQYLEDKENARVEVPTTTSPNYPNSTPNYSDLSNTPSPDYSNYQTTEPASQPSTTTATTTRTTSYTTTTSSYQPTTSTTSYPTEPTTTPTTTLPTTTPKTTTVLACLITITIIIIMVRKIKIIQ